LTTFRPIGLIIFNLFLLAISGSNGVSSDLQPVDEKILPPASADKSTRWFQGKSKQGARGVALVIHGLNLRPDRMQPLIEQLTESGIDVLNLSLSGHGDNFASRDGGDSSKDRLESFKAVSYEQWISEACAAYRLARTKSHQRKVPLSLVGFSLGGLIGVDLFATFPGVRFETMALFAPALKIHSRSYILRVLSPFPGLTLPSFSPEGYRANNKTPIAAYNALFKAIDHLEKNASPKINVPTVIFVDEQDEFVSFRRLRTWVEDEKLDLWKFFMLRQEASAKAVNIHHLIIDEPSTGKKVWKQMTGALVGHLLQD